MSEEANHFISNNSKDERNCSISNEKQLQKVYILQISVLIKKDIKLHDINISDFKCYSR